ncbi:MAG TPA: glutathione S-transferase family protein [Xanthobacteraceae bacterium]|jgi:glutathione S-transferase|nr:glutathione S-transferase family protein [Xanthobacteraceae bacterium]
MIRIWGRSTSLNVQKVLWLCVELGVKFERIDWAGPFGGNDDPAYLAKNPNGRVPTIEDGDKIVWESNSILRYLCAAYGGARLHPPEPYRRSEVERWMDWQLASLNPSMTTMLLGYYRTPTEKRDAAALEAARKEAIRWWSIVERFMAGRRYLAGDELTLADIGNGILVHRWHNYPIERPELPNLKAWYERLCEREGFRAHILGPIA